MGSKQTKAPLGVDDGGFDELEEFSRGADLVDDPSSDPASATQPAPQARPATPLDAKAPPAIAPIPRIQRAAAPEIHQPASPVQAPAPLATPVSALAKMDLLEADGEMLRRLSTFLSASEIERHRFFMKGRSMERQVELYELMALHKIHPDDPFMIAVAFLGFLGDFAQGIPDRMQGSLASAAAEVAQSMAGAMAPYGSVPSEIEGLVAELRGIFVKERKFHDLCVVDQQQSLIDHRAQTEELMVKFDGVAIEAKNQMLAGLEGKVMELIDKLEKASQADIAKIRAEKDSIVAASKAAAELHLQAMQARKVELERDMAKAAGIMVMEASKLAKEVAANADGLARKLAIFGGGIAAGMAILWMFIR